MSHNPRRVCVCRPVRFSGKSHRSEARRYPVPPQGTNAHLCITVQNTRSLISPEKCTESVWYVHACIISCMDRMFVCLFFSFCRFLFVCLQVDLGGLVRRKRADLRVCLQEASTDNQADREITPPPSSEINGCFFFCRKKKTLLVLKYVRIP